MPFFGKKSEKPSSNKPSFISKIREIFKPKDVKYSPGEKKKMREDINYHSENPYFLPQEVPVVSKNIPKNNPKNVIYEIENSDRNSELAQNSPQNPSKYEDQNDYNYGEQPPHPLPFVYAPEEKKNE